MRGKKAVELLISYKYFFSDYMTILTTFLFKTMLKYFASS